MTFRSNRAYVYNATHVAKQQMVIFYRLNNFLKHLLSTVHNLGALIYLET